MPTRFLSALVGIACRRPLATILALLLLAAGSLAYVAGNIRMTSDTADLIAADVPWRVAEARMDAAFPANSDTTIVVIDGATPEIADTAAATLTARLATQPGAVREATRLNGGAFFAREGLLFGSPADVAATTGRLIEAQPFLGPLAADPSLHGVAEALDTVAGHGDAATARRIDPALGTLAAALEAQAAGRPAFFSWQSLLGGGGGGRLAAPTRQLIRVRPVLDYGSLMPGADADDAVRSSAAALHLDAAHGVTVRLTGSVPLSDEEFASLADRWWLVAGAMVAAMLGTLWLATRSVRVTAAILATTALGLVVTTALGLLAIGRLNLISVAFIPLFVGLGVDFGIQLAVRVQDERHRGLAMADALGTAAARLGPSLLLAAGAVCLGFLAFLPTAYRGIAELGVIASMGMVVALLFSVSLLPALLVVLRPGRPAAEVGNPALAPLDALLLHRRRLVLGLFAVSMAASIALLPFVRFDFDPLHLRAPDGEAMATLTDLTRDPDYNPNTIDILAPDLPTAVRLARRLDRLPEVDHVVTAASLIPADQPAKLASIADANDLLGLTLDPFEIARPANSADTAAALSRAAASLRALATGSGGSNAARLSRQFDRLARSGAAQARAAAMLVPPLQALLGQVRTLLSAGPVALADLPPDLRRSWLTQAGQARLEVVPKAAFLDNAGLARFTRAVLAVAPGASGTAIATQAAAHTIAMAFVQAGVLALAIVTLLLFAVLRDIREVGFTLAPVVLSGFLTLGTCVLIGQPVNFANIIAFPLLFGVGTAFHIYFVMAWRAGATNLLQSSLARAIFFSALATGAAFGSLWFSRHPGTASMGKLLMISLIWTLVCALIFEPALLGPSRPAPAKPAGG